MRKLFGAYIAALCLVGVAGCASEPATNMTRWSPTPAAEPAKSGSATIEEVFGKIGCETEDYFGTLGVIEDGMAGKTPELVKQGSCTPVEDGEVAFFLQYNSDIDAQDALSSGQIEVGPSGAIYRDGAVLALARDATSAKLFAETLAE